MNTRNIPKLSGIYTIYNKCKDKYYIGSSVNLKCRLQRHKSELKHNKHSNKYLQRSYNKHKDCFSIDILETFENIKLKELRKLEEEYIDVFKTNKTGYNLIYSQSRFFKSYNKKLTTIQNVKNKLSKPVISFDMKTGKLLKRFKSVGDAAKFYKDSSSNISQICLNNANYAKGCTFCYESDYDVNKDYRYVKVSKKLSDIHKARIRVKIVNRLGKTVYKYDLNFNLISVYDSRRQAERKNELPNEYLRSRVDKQSPFGGYYWKHIKIEDIV